MDGQLYICSLYDVWSLKHWMLSVLPTLAFVSGYIVMKSPVTVCHHGLCRRCVFSFVIVDFSHMSLVVCRFSCIGVVQAACSVCVDHYV